MLSFYSGVINNLKQNLNRRCIWIKTTQSLFLHQRLILRPSSTLLTCLESLLCSMIRITTSVWWLGNCLGNSTPAEIHVRIINNCSLVRDGILIDNCLPSDEIIIATTTGEMMANKSTNDSSSDLGPQQHCLGMHAL